MGAFWPWVVVYCYLDSKFRHLKFLKLFSIKVKKKIVPLFLWKKRLRGFALFKCFFFFVCFCFCFCFVLFCFVLFCFFFWETDLWVNARWFYGKKREIGKANMYTQNQSSSNEMWWVAKNTIICVTLCATGFLDSNFN